MLNSEIFFQIVTYFSNNKKTLKDYIFENLATNNFGIGNKDNVYKIFLDRCLFQV